MFLDGEFGFEPSTLCLPTLPFQLAELFHGTTEPGRQHPRTGNVVAERGMLVKDRTKTVVVVSDRACWRESVREILLEGVNVNLSETAV